MPITLRHITGDSTWLITLTSSQNPPSHAPYIILVDPWIEGPSSVYHPKFAQNHRTIPSSISSLAELKPQPNLLLISQSKTDHCNEATCRQLPKEGIRVYAVPGADTIVRNWKHFNSKEVHRLRPFNSRKKGRVSRIPIYKTDLTSQSSDGASQSDLDGFNNNNYIYESDPNVAAVVEIAFLPAQRIWEIPNLHIALGISYTPTSDMSEQSSFPPSPPLTPPSSNLLLPMTLPSMSASTLSVVSSRNSTVSPLASPISAVSTISTATSRPPLSPLFQKSSSRKSLFLSANSTLSRTNEVNHKLPGPKTSLTETVLYSPHGVPPSALTTYISSIPLPITAFLHCFVRVDNPKWLGGTVSAGAPNAFKIIEDMKSARALQVKSKRESTRLNRNGDNDASDSEWALGVKYLIPTHDEEVEMEGFVKYFVKKSKFELQEIDETLREIAGEEKQIISKVGNQRKDTGTSTEITAWDGPAGVKLLDLGVGEEAVLS